MQQHLEGWGAACKLVSTALPTNRRAESAIAAAVTAQGAAVVAGGRQRSLRQSVRSRRSTKLHTHLQARLRVVGQMLRRAAASFSP